VSELNGECVLALTGELDMATAPDFAAALDPLLQHGPDEVIIDLSAVSFLDSSGIAVLVTGQQDLNQQDRRLAVRGARPHAQKVFEIAGLVEFLRVEIAPEGSPTH
jgi:anti-sigma B factor antagonist